MRKYSKRDVGRNVAFHGFDGKCYAATILQVRHGIVTIGYNVPVIGHIRATIEKPALNRLQGFDAIHGGNVPAQDA